MNKFSAACLSLIMATTLCAFDEIQPPPLYFGSNVPMPIIHSNGSYAWSGVYPKESYAPERAFFHDNRSLMWGGLIQERLSFTSDKAYFNYVNGQKAWGGLYQSRLRWTSDDAKFYHSNGQMAWGGLDQNVQYWMTSNGKFFHANGELAWDGVFGSKVFYDTGKVAWNGKPKSHVFDKDGKFVSVADYVSICLGYNNWLYVSSDRRFELILDLGPGYKLRVKNNTVLLDVYGTMFDITNDF
jgi:hypothetical protein